MANRIFYRVNYGFRSLIDWSSTKSVSGPSVMMGEEEKEVVHRSGGSGLTGPYSFAQGGRPLEDQITGRTKIPGSDGAYWDIPYFNKPALSYGGKTKRTKSDYLRNLDVYAQQWIYLAAEKSAAIMHQVKEEQQKGKTEKQKEALEKEYNQLLKFFGSDDEAMRIMGASMSRNTFPVGFNEQLQEIKEQKYASAERHIDNRGIGPSIEGKFHYQKQGSAYKRIDEFPPLQRHYFSMSQKEDVPMQLKHMMTGLTSGKTWINAFSRSMDNKGVPYMKQLAYFVDEYIHKQGKKIANELGLDGSEDVKGALKGLVEGRAIEKVEYEPNMSAGGPIQERALVAAEVAESASDAVAGYKSKPIDVKFIEKAAVDIGSIKGIRDFDLTKSLYGESGPRGHHGTIPGLKLSKFDSYIVDNTKGIEKSIKESYENDRIPVYNNIMRIIMQGTGKGSPKEAREAMRAKGSVKYGKDASGIKQFAQKAFTEIRPQAGGHKYRAGQTRAFANAASQAQNAILRKAGQDVANMTRENLFYTLEWVLHHMGQEVIPETYGNMMGIPLPDGTLGTLLIGFKTNSKGFYTGVDVVILDDITPIEWLYERALIVDKTLSLDAFLEGANVGLAMAQLEGAAQIGALSKFAQIIKASGYYPRIAMGRLSEPKFSKQLERVMEAVFSMMGKNISETLNRQIKDDAVKFSKVSRHPSMLGAVPGWYTYAWRTMLDRESSPSLGNDPFWFLWAAPYVSGGVPGEGGSKQRQAAGARKY